MTRMNIVMSLAMIPPMLIADGCSGSGKLADLAEEIARRQAAQQEKLIDETRRISEASRELVEADADARQELIECQSEIQQGNAIKKVWLEARSCARITETPIRTYRNHRRLHRRRHWHPARSTTLSALRANLTAANWAASCPQLRYTDHNRD